MNILINALGIADSGGLTVLKKTLNECVAEGASAKFIVFLSGGINTDVLTNLYKSQENFTFKVVTFKNYFQRLYFENYKMRKIVKRKNIDLVYNFSGTAQFFLGRPQLVKFHNLIFFSKVLDKNYIRSGQLRLWLSQVYFKRLALRLMLRRAANVEIQSPHVKNCISDYLEVDKKNFFVKSDVQIDNSSFNEVKAYDFSKQIRFVYVVGPHFSYRHKNFGDFVDAMLALRNEGVDFSIDITLTRDQLETSMTWCDSLDLVTTFHGYISDPQKMRSLFTDNTILVSTSIIETLGLHVLEGIGNGVATITPREPYAATVYGPTRFSYDISDIDSFCATFASMRRDSSEISQTVGAQQGHVKSVESEKFQNIVHIFREILDV